MANTKNIELNIDISKEYRRLSNKKYRVVLWMLFISFALFCVNVSFGTSSQNIFELLSQAIEDVNSKAFIVLWDLRLPHALCSLIAGATLGICGCILQSTLGNPLASPSTIGISQGASCGACIAIIMLSTLFAEQNITIIILAFIFALIPTLLIYSVSILRKLNATSIILIGVAISIFFSGLVAMIQYFADSSKIAELIFWTFGSVYNAQAPELFLMTVIMLFGLLYAVFNSWNFNALECGDATAHSVGVNVRNSRLRHLIIAAICAACVTAFCGTINFIGLIAPHIMRRFVGSNYKCLVISSAFCGACILTISDIVSSLLIPGVILPIGAITSFIGAPIFIYVLIKKNKDF